MSVSLLTPWAYFPSVLSGDLCLPRANLPSLTVSQPTALFCGPASCRLRYVLARLVTVRLVVALGAPLRKRISKGDVVSQETVIGGTVLSAGQPLGGAYVRLLDASGEFTAEVVTSAQGSFRFFARPGTWTVRALLPRGDVESSVDAELGNASEVRLCS